MPREKRPYVVAEIGPTNWSARDVSSTLLVHVNNLPHAKVNYIGLDPVIHGEPATSHFKRNAREGVGVEMHRYSLPEDLPLPRNSVDELHAHATYPMSGTSLDVTTERFLEIASRALRKKGKLFVSGDVGVHPLAVIVQMDEKWLRKRGFRIIEKDERDKASAFSFYASRRAALFQKFVALQKI